MEEGCDGFVGLRNLVVVVVVDVDPVWVEVCFVVTGCVTFLVCMFDKDRIFNFCMCMWSGK